MADKPLIFSAPMVHALLDGRKTMTRRVLKPQFQYMLKDRFERWKSFSEEHWQQMFAGVFEDGTGCIQSLPYAPGCRIWVREGFAYGWPVFPGEDFPRNDGPHAVTYRASCGRPFGGGRWHSPIYMPKWASRLTLIVTDVRVQRVQEINGMDAKREGVSIPSHLPQDGADLDFAKRAFHALWDDLNAKRGFGWDANPWVVALTFTVHHQNIDQLQQEAA